MINNKKNETFVEYPLNNLDLTTYFLGESDSVVYDLCSIICHKGTIKQGHNYVDTVRLAACSLNDTF